MVPPFFWGSTLVVHHIIKSHSTPLDRLLLFLAVFGGPVFTESEYGRIGSAEAQW